MEGREGGEWLVPSETKVTVSKNWVHRKGAFWGSKQRGKNIKKWFFFFFFLESVSAVFQLCPDGHQWLGEILRRSLLRVSPPVSAQSHRVCGRLGHGRGQDRVLDRQELLGGVLGQCPSLCLPLDLFSRACVLLCSRLLHTSALSLKATQVERFQGRPTDALCFACGFLFLFFNYSLFSGRTWLGENSHQRLQRRKRTLVQPGHWEQLCIRRPGSDRRPMIGWKEVKAFHILPTVLTVN